VRLRRHFVISLALLGGLVMVGVVLFWPRGDGPLYQGKSIHAWARQLLAPGPEVRGEAAAVLKGLGSNAVPGLIRMLETRDPLWRRQLWTSALRLPPRLRRGLLRYSPVPQEQANHQAAALALAVVGPEAKTAVPALGRALVSNEPANRWDFADALGAIGKASLSVLTNALENKDPGIRAAAVLGLTRLGPAAGPAVPPLVQRLKDADPEVRSRAVRALSAIGPAAAPALVHAIEDERGLVRQGAAEALASPAISWRQVEPALLGMLHDDDPASRCQALATLAAVHARDERAILAMAAALKDPAPEVRLAAAGALGDLCWKAQPAVPALIEALMDDTAPVRSSAARTLGLIGPPAEMARKALSDLSMDSDPAVRSAANEALLKIAAGPRRAGDR
jgi:HEAT repeat protein